MSDSGKGPEDIANCVFNAEILQLPRNRSSGRVKSEFGLGNVSGDRSSGETPRSLKEFIDDLNSSSALVLMGSRAVIIREQPDAPIEDRMRVLSVDAFKMYYRNVFWQVKRIFENEAGEREEKTTYVNAGNSWLASPWRRSYGGIEFWPDKDNKPGTTGYFNLWRGFSVAPSCAPPETRRRCYSVFEDHLRTNVANGNEEHFRWLWHWFAHILQRPRERIGTAVVLRGKMGTGKTVLGEVIGSLFASHYFLVDDPRYLTGQFNAHMASCLLLQVDEGFWAGDKAAEGRLKGLVTAKTQMIESKGHDPIRLTNYVRLLFSSNESWVVPAGLEERRFAVFDIGDGARQNHGYFHELFAQLNNGGREALLADLLATNLDAPDAPDVRVIPKTQALLEQKLRSLDPVQSWWYERLRAGSPTKRSHAWPAQPVPILTLHADYMRTADRIGVRRKSDSTAFDFAMRRLIPSLPRAARRVTDVETIGEDGRWITETRRVYCWCLPSLAECRGAFEEAVCQQIDWPDEDETKEADDDPI